MKVVINYDKETGNLELDCGFYVGNLPSKMIENFPWDYLFEDRLPKEESGQTLSSISNSHNVGLTAEDLIKLKEAGII